MEDKQLLLKFSQWFDGRYAEMMLHAFPYEDGVTYSYDHDFTSRYCKTFAEAIDLAQQEWERKKHELVKPADSREDDSDYKCEA